MGVYIDLSGRQEIIHDIRYPRGGGEPLHCPPMLAELQNNIFIDFPWWEWAVNVVHDDSPEGIPLPATPQNYRMGIVVNLLTEFSLYAFQDGSVLETPKYRNVALDCHRSSMPFYSPKHTEDGRELHFFYDVIFSSEGIASQDSPTDFRRSWGIHYRDYPGVTVPLLNPTTQATFHLFYGTRSFQIFYVAIPRPRGTPLFMAYSDPFTIELLAIFHPPNPETRFQVVVGKSDCGSFGGKLETWTVPEDSAFPIAPIDVDSFQLLPRPTAGSENSAIHPVRGTLPEGVNCHLRGRQIANERAANWHSRNRSFFGEVPIRR
ncbi:hypothetical protein SAMN05216386_0834 [Nitrosospira briensis]|uniref:Uncharacterized protein n=1 Tax=Nitrosospira briensis TaxID=35799 RepID=A0A1I4YRB6_9PROT|nr:hypothetical protein [Nitrosospira briensis]SFN40313.1 hypothetical protein SAMN05216386_0834 [Nitrosospira briensis]